MTEEKISISIDEDKTVSDKIRSLNRMLFVNKKDKTLISRKSLNAIFSKWVSNNIKENKLKSKKLEIQIGSILGQGIVSDKQLSTILGMKNNIKSHEGMTELLQKLGYNFTKGEDEFSFDLQIEEE